MTISQWWYNFDDGKWEVKGTPTTDEEAMKCLPSGPARNLYSCHRADDKSILESLMITLMSIAACPGVKQCQLNEKMMT